MSLFFVRHTQSEANLAGLLGGRADYPLTTQGVADAQSIATEFCSYLAGQGKMIDQIISSPLLRARQTAEQMAAILLPKFTSSNGSHRSQIRVEPLLIEQDMGKFTGLSYAELDGQLDYIHDRTRRWDWQPPASPQNSQSDGLPQYPGESYHQIAQRVSQFFGELASNQELQGQNILLVSHAVTLRLVYGYLRKMFPAYLENIPQNGEIWQVDNMEPSSQNPIQRHFFSGSHQSKA